VFFYFHLYKTIACWLAAEATLIDTFPSILRRPEKTDQAATAFMKLHHGMPRDWPIYT